MAFVRSDNRFHRAGLCLLVLWADPTAAHANGIGIEAVFLGIIPLTLFVVLVALAEAAVLRPLLKVTYRQAFALMLAANAVSTAAGIPVKILNALFYTTCMPRPLAPYFHTYPYFVALGTLNFFVVTLLAECWVVVRGARRKELAIPRGRLLRAVVVVNVLSYAVLAPLHYWATRPDHNLRSLTDDTRWAREPAQRVYYVAPDRTLHSVLSNGHDDRVAIPDTVDEYQYYPGAGIYLYRNHDDWRLRLCRESDGALLSCSEEFPFFMMAEATCSPDGQRVAWLRDADAGNACKLVLFDVASQARVTARVWTESDMPRAAVWSDHPSLLYLRNGDTFRAVHFREDMTVDQVEDLDPAEERPLVEAYACTWWETGIGWPQAKAHAGDCYATAMPPHIDRHLRVVCGDTEIRLADNPGLLGYPPRRWFRRVAFLGNESELVFDDGHDLYLLDIPNARVGRITEGHTPMVLSPSCSIDFWRARPWEW